MGVILGLILLIMGVTAIIRPATFFFLEKWKYDGKAKPSKAFLMNIRLGGIPLIIVSIVMVYLSLF